MKETRKRHTASRRRLRLAVLLGLLSVLLCACGSEEATTLPQSDPIVKRQDMVAEKYDLAVQALESAGNYKMTGSVTSVAEIQPDGAQTVNVDTVECIYDHGRMQTTVTSNTDPHSTYFDGERYYFLVGEGDSAFRYFTGSNDHSDYLATDYLLPVDAEIISNVTCTENSDGSVSLYFEIPFAIYASPAMQGWLGVVVDETHEAKRLSITATVDRNGYFTEFSLSFINDTAFGEETIHQEIVALMSLSDYAAAEITAPTDLSAYKDWSATEDPDDLEWAENISPEDVE